MQVKEIMSQPVMVVQENATLEDVARTMLDNHFGCVPVVNQQGKLSGIITESDFAAQEKGLSFSTFRAPQALGQWLGIAGIERIYEAARTLTVSAIMKTNVVTVTEDQPMDEAVKLMLRHGINRIPVVRNGWPVDMLARHDLLNLMVRHKNGAKAK